MYEAERAASTGSLMLMRPVGWIGCFGEVK